MVFIEAFDRAPRGDHGSTRTGRLRDSASRARRDSSGPSESVQAACREIARIERAILEGDDRALKEYLVA